MEKLQEIKNLQNQVSEMIKNLADETSEELGELCGIYYSSREAYSENDILEKDIIEHFQKTRDLVSRMRNEDHYRAIDGVEYYYEAVKEHIEVLKLLLAQ